MTKGPILAIATSIILTLLIFLFLDIRPPLVDTEETVPILSLAAPNDAFDKIFIDEYNQTLSPADQSVLQSYTDQLTDQNSLAAIDSIIAFYEEREQYNFSAWYHSPKAELMDTKDAWLVAGDRQYSVSQNDAYDAEFNHFLHNQAVISYANAVEKDSTDIDAKVKLATIYLEDETQTMQGITMLLDVVAQDSLHIDANLLLGKFGIVSAQFEKAVQRLENVVSLQPDNAEALFLLAEAYNGLGETNKAIDALKKCQSLVENEELKQEIQAYIEQLSL
ncbi:MAG: tetratricopeptide repeat protein [Chitinophagales bacterium]